MSFETGAKIKRKLSLPPYFLHLPSHFVLAPVRYLQHFSERMHHLSRFAAISFCLSPFSFIHAQDAAAASPATGEKATQPSGAAGAVVKKQEITIRLTRRVILPEVEFKGVSVPVALKELEKLYAAAAPDSHPVRFILVPEAVIATKGKTVTLSLKNVPLGAVLAMVETQADLEFIESLRRFSGVVFQERNPAEVPPDPPQKLTPLLAKAAKWRVPKVDFAQTAMPDILQALNAFAMEADPAKKGIPIFMSEADLRAYKNTKVTLILNDLPVLEVIKYVTNLTNMQYEEKDGKIVLSIIK